MHVLLVVPPYRTTDTLVAQLYPLPYAAVLLGTVLQEAGHEVVIKDFLVPAQKHKTKSPASFADKHAPAYVHYGVPLLECKEWLDDNLSEFDVVGLCMCQCNVWETGSKIAKHIKSHKMPLVIGGPFVTTATEEALHRTGADIAVTGEGEGVVVDAMERAVDGENGVIRGFPVPIADIPLPNWNLAPLENYPRYKNRVRGVLTISRGCPHGCKFCSVHTIMGRKHRRQNRPRIKAEIENLWNHGVRYMCFLDDNLFLSRMTTYQILKIINKLKIDIPGFDKVKFYVEEGIEVRIAAIPSLSKDVVDTGFENVGLGVETVNEQRLKEQSKPHDVALLNDAVRNCLAAGIVPKAFYILGFPGDTVESICKDLVEFGKLGVSVRSNNLKLYPGTETTQEFLGLNIIDSTYDWRMSSWYTPPSGALTFKQIRKLKTVLGAIGFAADAWGVAIFNDELDTIFEKVNNTKYTLHFTNENRMVLEGNMFRPTPYKHFMEMLMLTVPGPCGAHAMQVAKNRIEVWALDKPKDDIQAALWAAIHDKPVPKQHKPVQRKLI